MSRAIVSFYYHKPKGGKCRLSVKCKINGGTNPNRRDVQN